MSIEVSSLVISRKIGSPSRKVVLMIMADAANPDGTGVWVSKPNIALRSEVSLKTVKRSIQDMLKEGLIEAVGERKNSNGFTTIYNLKLDKIRALERTQKIKNEEEIDTGHFDPRDTVTPDTGTQRPPTRGHSDPQTVLEPSLTVHTQTREGKASREFVKAVLARWNAMSADSGLEPISLMTPQRVGWIDRRLEDCGGDEALVMQAIDRVPFDPHRAGLSPGGWQADFDWVFSKAQRFTQCLESQTDRRNKESPQNAKRDYPEETVTQRRSREKSERADRAVEAAIRNIRAEGFG